MYASPDKITWTHVATEFADVHETTQLGDNSWVATRVTGKLPDGSNYIGFTIHGAVGHIWTPQVGRISLETGAKSAEPGPAGLSVLAAGGKASLAWYPIDGATDYRIERRTVAVRAFQTIADGIKSTSYIDNDLKSDTKYYYAVIANTATGATGESDEVLAVPSADAAVMTDPLADWSLTAAHSPNLTFDGLRGEAACVHPTGKERGTFDYSVAGATNFLVNVFSPDPDMGDSVQVETSPDGANWSIVPTSFKLPAAAVPGLFAAVCTPAGELPVNTNFIRFSIRPDSSNGVSPSMGQVRIKWDGRAPEKTAATHRTPSQDSP